MTRRRGARVQQIGGDARLAAHQQRVGLGQRAARGPRRSPTTTSTRACGRRRARPSSAIGSATRTSGCRVAIASALGSACSGARLIRSAPRAAVWTAASAVQLDLERVHDVVRSAWSTQPMWPMRTILPSGCPGHRPAPRRAARAGGAAAPCRRRHRAGSAVVTVGEAKRGSANRRMPRSASAVARVLARRAWRSKIAPGLRRASGAGAAWSAKNRLTAGVHGVLAVSAAAYGASCQSK